VSAVAHLRALLLTTIARAKVTLQAIHSEEDDDTNLVRLRAEMSALRRNNEAIEQVVVRLSIEDAVSTVGWSIAKSQ
jgi:putative Mg2+ transporter-C (MgtC) family protein